MYAGTSLGDQYQAILAHGGEGDFSTPEPWERTIGDLVSPTRPGSATAFVNVASRSIGADVAEWRVDRLLSMIAGLESREQPDS